MTSSATDAHAPARLGLGVRDGVHAQRKVSGGALLHAVLALGGQHVGGGLTALSDVHATHVHTSAAGSAVNALCTSLTSGAWMWLVKWLMGLMCWTAVQGRPPTGATYACRITDRCRTMSASQSSLDSGRDGMQAMHMTVGRTRRSAPSVHWHESTIDDACLPPATSLGPARAC